MSKRAPPARRSSFSTPASATRRTRSTKPPAGRRRARFRTGPAAPTAPCTTPSSGTSSLIRPARRSRARIGPAPIRLGSGGECGTWPTANGKGATTRTPIGASTVPCRRFGRAGGDAVGRQEDDPVPLRGGEQTGDLRLGRGPCGSGRRRIVLDRSARFGEKALHLVAGRQDGERLAWSRTNRLVGVRIAPRNVDDIARDCPNRV